MDEELREIFIDVPWGKLCIVCRGLEVNEPIILVHGRLDSAGTFFPLIKYFPQHYWLIMIELPGCAKSSPFPTGHPIDLLNLIFCTKTVVDYFKLTKFTYIGHSMGVTIGLIYNAIYPDYITKLISLDHITYPPLEAKNYPAYYKYHYENFYKNYKIYESKNETIPLYTYENALQSVIKKREIDKSAAEAVLQRILVPISDNLYRFLLDQRYKNIIVPLFTEQFQIDLFGNMKIPFLIILTVKSVHDNVEYVRTHVVEELFKTNPNFRLKIIDGNHDIHLNSPELISSLILPFLQGNQNYYNDTNKSILYLENLLKNKKSKL